MNTRWLAVALLCSGVMACADKSDGGAKSAPTDVVAGDTGGEANVVGDTGSDDTAVTADHDTLAPTDVVAGDTGGEADVVGDAGSDDTVATTDLGMLADNGTVDAGGPPTTCTADSDCQASDYVKMVGSEDECYCAECPGEPMTVEMHQANMVSWAHYCTDWSDNNPCPDVACEQPPPVICKQGACAWDTEDPPPSDTCESDDECVMSYYSSPIGSVNDCYCLDCPTHALTTSQEDARSSDWQQHCTEWAVAEGCQEKDCANPGPAACQAGQCIWGKDQCPNAVVCGMVEPDCEAPLIAVAKNGCWGCGHPETCSCSDGPVLCESLPPDCPAGTELAEQDGCYECVDPMTCKPKAP